MRLIVYLVIFVMLICLLMRDEKKYADLHVRFARAFRRRFAKILTMPVVGRLTGAVWVALAVGAGICCVASAHTLDFPFNALTFLFGCLSMLGAILLLPKLFSASSWKRFVEEASKQDSWRLKLLTKRPRMLKWIEVLALVTFLLLDVVSWIVNKR